MADVSEIKTGFVRRFLLRSTIQSVQKHDGELISEGDVIHLAGLLEEIIPFAEFVAELQTLADLTQAAIASGGGKETFHTTLIFLGKQCIKLPQVEDIEEYKQIRFLPTSQIKRIVLAAIQWHRWRSRFPDNDRLPRALEWASSFEIAGSAARHLIARQLRWERPELTLLLRLLCPLENDSSRGLWPAQEKLIELLEKQEPLQFTDDEREHLRMMREVRGQHNRWPETRWMLRKIDEWLGTPWEWPIEAGEAWADLALGDLATLSEDRRVLWRDVFEHALCCTTVKPNKKWFVNTTPLIESIGAQEFAARVDCWLSKIGCPGRLSRRVGYSEATNNTLLSPSNQNVLCGLAWMASTMRFPRVLRALADAAEASFRAIPRIGPRCLQLGNSCTRAIASIANVGSHDAIAQLVRLELRVRQPKGRKLVKKLLTEAIERSGLTRQAVEETTVPDFGLRDGQVTIEVGEWSAHIDATGGARGPEPTVTWHKPDGKVARCPTPTIKKTHADEVETVQRTLKDLESMLPAQRTRLELLLRDVRTWRLDLWRQRYLDHGLLGPLVRRLIWSIDQRPVLFLADGTTQDVTGQPIEFADSAEVAVWHPIGRPVDEVVAWRARLEHLRITQPFKQAHREVYLLTDAERRTHTYSNRFAAHIVKSHVLIAIGQVRAWKVSLYGHATLDLPQFGLRAEFWSNAAGDDYTPMGGPMYLSTDQVRFYRGDDPEPLPVSEVPPLAFTEVMRDADLFVGIASIGADPTWQDCGMDRYQVYWQSFSFGELSGSAKTRREILERIVPRLKIASRCSFTERFLVVRGDRRIYKIHLGSGNILMEPNDQYLCIVKAPAREAKDPVFLPFEGDNTLAVIMSKAFLLAEDSNITDPTIVRQIAMN